MFIDSIPGFLSNDEPKHLYNLTKVYNSLGCVGVEIGSFQGRSSAIIAQAIPNGTLYCIDLWDNRVEKNLNGLVSSVDEFQRNISNYTNICTIQGNSPECVSGWSEIIDFIFIDASHANPNDRKNIDFWLPHIRSGGSLIGHDYDPDMFPDVVENARYLESLLGVDIEINGSIWSIKIP